MRLEYARKMANEYKKINKQLKLDIVGSIARKQPNGIKDIDFITTLELPNGKNYFKTKYNDIPIDIWRVKERQLGKFLRTVDKGHIIAIRKALKDNGYSLRGDGIFDIKNKKLIKFTLRKLDSLLKQFAGVASKTFIQSILFSRKKWELEDAKKWFYQHNYEMPPHKEVHMTKTFIRFRVQHPDYEKYQYKTKWLSKDEGIKAIFGFPK